jgi:hypothetical protein
VPRKGQITRSVRIDKDVDEHLRQLAEEQRVSVNLLANKALRRFTEWDAYGEKFGFLSIPSGLFAKLMDYLTNEQAKELGEWVGRDLVKEYVMFWFKDMSTETVLEAFPRLFARYSRSFDYEERNEGPNHVAILKHNRGMKWSLYYGAVVEAMFRELVHQPVRVERSDNQIVARFRTV